MAAVKVLVSNLSHRFGKLPVLENLSLFVRPGEFVTLVGTSGCGKSTLLNIVAGLIEPERGDVMIDGQPVTGPGRDRGVVFQSYSLFPWLTVRGNIEFALKKTPMPAGERRDLIAHYINAVGLSGFEDAFPNQLSGGMKQRVAIARSLVYRPSVLLMDEPFGALDAQTRGLMQELLIRVIEEHRSTVLFITHDVDEAIFMSDRVYVMTARPGSIKREVEIDLPHPRHYDIITSPEFIDLKRSIVGSIREETLKAMAAPVR